MRNLLLVLAGAVQLSAQVYPAGPQVVTFFSSVDDSDQPYALYVPRRFDPSRKYPLVVSLHDAGSNHRLNLRRVFGRGNRVGETDAEASRYFPPLKDVDFIVVSPLARGTLGYKGIVEKDVYDMLADVKRRFPIDEDRLYLTGISMGGGGALWLGLTRPDMWAAIAALCPQTPPGTENLISNASNLPVRLFHGAQDFLVPVSVSRKWNTLLADAGSPVEYTEFPSLKHNVWDAAYRDGSIFTWFSTHTRNRFPPAVHLRSSQYKYASAYWVEITGLTPGTLSSIDATFTAANKLSIHTSHVQSFMLKLDGHPMYRAALPLEIILDGTVLKTKITAFSNLGNGWRPLPLPQAAGSKRAGIEGPLSEVFSGRHIYVYGTGGSPGDDEINRRRDLAKAAAEWSTPTNRLQLNLRVAMDRELNDADLRSANLVLFGSRETNGVIARMAPQLPFHLNAGAADYGLFYVWPMGGRTVAINSGLLFSTGVEYTKRIPFRFLVPATVVDSFGDYILFKGSLENVVVEGRFDAHWNVPPGDLEKMVATGAVSAAGRRSRAETGTGSGVAKSGIAESGAAKSGAAASRTAAPRSKAR